MKAKIRFLFYFSLKKFISVIAKIYSVTNNPNNSYDSWDLV